MNSNKFEGKTVLITGASSGIGKQAAIDFASHGSKRVIMVARSLSRLREVEREIGMKHATDLSIFHCDVSIKEDVLEMGRQITKEIGDIDILINNAGFGIYGRVQDQTIEELESVTNTNYLGAIFCTKVFLNSMLKRHSGHIVNVASLAGSFGIPGLAAYCGSKFAMLGFFESLRHELKGTGIGVTVVSPIGVRTNFFKNDSFKNNGFNSTYFMLDPKTVSKAILAAANSPRFEITVPFLMRAAVWLKYTFPFLVNPLVGAHFNRQLNKKGKQTQGSIPRA